ncbi:hypothetical protein DFH08DRAFT_520651 [Mycena albidolilacea]|uniref:Uncharacterized protein n=1 Tax=Mycena albidolilacea TaxID=1033008 RepID=A0AAD6Z336_9AGAR|nr:hypothetical protein DFH08DRAFT_520651 [Mycena albidolilacea]
MHLGCPNSQLCQAMTGRFTAQVGVGDPAGRLAATRCSRSSRAARPSTRARVLPCARIGTIDSVVLTRFSAESLCHRAKDCACCDEGCHRGKVMATKTVADAALKQCPRMRHCLVVCRTGGTPGR